MENLKEKLFIRQLFLMLVDGLGIVFTFWFIGDILELVPAGYARLDVPSLALIVALSLIVYIVCGMYTSLWEYGGEREIFQILIATSIATIFNMLIGEVMGNRFRIHSYLFVWMMMLFLAGGVRLGYRMFRGYLQRYSSIGTDPGDRVLLIGAGYMGSLVIRRIQDGILHIGKIVAVIDDDNAKLHQSIHGIRIVGNRDYITTAVKKYKIETIVFAITNINRNERKELYTRCVETGCKLLTTQDFASLIHDANHQLMLRPVEVQDLLNRKEVTLDMKAISAYISNRVIMVSGGGGSIGSEICRQVAFFNPRQIIIFDIYENNAFELRNELRDALSTDIDIVVQIGSVRDEKRLAQVFDEYRPDVVYHAAAHKHVPLMEASPSEAIKNNVFGTLNMIRTANAYKVKSFVMISTDKAVNPTNVMGATKRLAEMVVQSFSQHATTKFAVVRFGNVLGSNGSVIPIFKKQIEHGGPVTVTHKDIIRYFMTIPEASRLVIQAGSMAKGGEIYILDMGEPVKILNLAENLIRLSGYEPYKDIEIKFSGLRPGEKMFEELQMSDEETLKTDNPSIMVSESVIAPREEVIAKLKTLEACLDAEPEQIKRCLAEVLTTYQPDMG